MHGGEIIKLKRPKRIIDAIFALMLIASAIFLVRVAPVGYNGYDEMFYLSVPYRLTQGDALIVNEWHPAQLAGFLTWPLMRAFLAINGGTEGIVLTFRYIYIAAHTLAAVCVYLILRKKNAAGAVAAAISFYLFIPYYRLALSYNSMGIGLLLLAGLLMATAERGRGFAAAGLMFAGAVLCCPYLMIIYGIYCALTLLRAICGARGILDARAFDWRAWGGFTLGAAAIAAALCAAILSRAGVDEVIAALPNIFNDPEHVQIDLKERITLYIRHLCLSRAIARLASFGTAGILIISALDKGRARRRWLYLAAAAVITLIYLAASINRYRYINYLMLPLNILGVTAYALTRDKNRGIFMFVFIPGWIFSFFKSMASNQFYYALTEALAVSTAASAYFILALLCEMHEENKSAARGRRTLNLTAAALSAAAILGLWALLIRDRAEIACGNCRTTGIDAAYTLTARMNGGVADGLYGTEEQAQEYAAYMDAAKAVREYDGATALYFTWEQWLCLEDEKLCAAYSQWLSLTSPVKSAARLEDYWRLNPDRRPDVIFLDKELAATDGVAQQIDVEGYTLTENEKAYVYKKA